MKVLVAYHCITATGAALNGDAVLTVDGDRITEDVVRSIRMLLAELIPKAECGAVVRGKVVLTNIIRLDD